MKLKENTERSSDQLRGIAMFVLLLGIVIAVFIIGLGIATSKNSHSYSGVFYRLVDEGVLSCLIVGILVMFWHYVIYALISAFATIVENSDRSDVVEVLWAINDNLKKSNESSGPSQSVVQKAVDAVTKKQDITDDVKLQKIDITDYTE